MYHTALMLYQKLRPHVSIDELGSRLAGVLLVLGDWDQANRLIGLLPVEDSSVRLLRSELAFVRGDFDGALAEAEMALIDSSAERVHVLIRLADIPLYLPDPYDTVAAALRCATRATSLRSGLVSAVRLGGDTDTVAALVGGLMGGNLTAEQVRAELPWHQLVVLPEPESGIAETAAALTTARAIQSV